MLFKIFHYYKHFQFSIIINNTSVNIFITLLRWFSLVTFPEQNYEVKGYEYFKVHITSCQIVLQKHCIQQFVTFPISLMFHLCFGYCDEKFLLVGWEKNCHV